SSTNTRTSRGEPSPGGPGSSTERTGAPPKTGLAASRRAADWVAHPASASAAMTESATAERLMGVPPRPLQVPPPRAAGQRAPGGRARDRHEEIAGALARGERDVTSAPAPRIGRTLRDPSLAS